MKIGIVKEGKIPVDHRVAFTPEQCKAIKEKYPEIELVVQPSNLRAFTDIEYREQGIQMQSDLNDCDILFGVKEVNIEDLIPNKTYFFFSHTIKKQTYNQKLLKTILEKKITLVDYECLTNSVGIRVVAFGRFAGLVGAYNAFRTYGLKKKTFELKPAHTCHDQLELFHELGKITGENIKVILTGGGRVAKGAMEVLDEAGFTKVEIDEMSEHVGNCYLQLDSYEYNKRKDGADFSFDDFFANPKEYVGTFKPFLSQADIFIAGAYWDPKAPVLFELSDLQSPDFRFEVIADITCDIDGSVPTTVRPTTIEEPFYDFNKQSLKEEPAFSKIHNLTVMAVDNLPCELPRDASESFGEQLMQNVIPALLEGKKKEIVDGAKIAENGRLTEKFNYLSDFVNL